jgi:hypothetical protein
MSEEILPERDSARDAIISAGICAPEDIVLTADLTADIY